MSRKKWPTTQLDRKRTVRRTNLKTRRREIWAAYSKDGIWAYGRGEERGTPWFIRHIPTDRILDHPIGSLEQAQRDTASGWALRQLDKQTAERAAQETEASEAETGRAAA